MSILGFNIRIPNYIRRLSLVILIGVVLFLSEKYGLISSFMSWLSIPTGVSAEIIGGISTTAVLFCVYLFFTPIVEISPKIYKYPDGKYYIKVYNSGIFSIYEFRAYLTKCTPHKMPKGKINMGLKGIKVGFNYLEFIPSRFSRNVEKEGCLFAQIHNISEDEKIEDVLGNDDSLAYYRFTVSCRSSFSGLRKIKVEKYTHPASIVEGKFDCGATFKKI